MDFDLSTKYDMRVPRYTSYPTAPHFSDAVGPDTYRGWLGEMEAGTGLSLYSHIPFCDSMCWFCGCYTKIVKRYEPVRDYLDVLLDEIDLVADALPGRFTAHHMHWGGGSPTMLKGSDWMGIIERMRARFDVAPSAEIALELDPRTTTEGYVKAMAAAGVNRASIGVQDFDIEVQQAINRIQPFDVTERVVNWLRRHGIDHVNMDLMYGLPHQTTERVRREVELALILKPARVALFGYAHVPWMKSHQKMIDEASLPGTEDRFEQFLEASRMLAEAGYVAVGLDHFALPTDEMAIALKEGRLRRNFQGYTSDRAPVLLGFGASSIGNLPQGYVQNVLPLRDYSRAIGEKRLATGKGLELSAEDRLRSDVIERIMCELTVDLEAVAAHHGTTAGHFAADLEKIASLTEDGLCTLEGGRISVSEAGRPFVRLVAAAFDTYLTKGPGRHSKAV